MVENYYSVNKKQWKKWNDTERQCFIDLYESMIESPWIYIPVEERDTPPAFYETTAWNAAWMAAELMRYNRKFNG